MSRAFPGSTPRLSEVMGERFGTAAALESLPIGVCVCDRDGALVHHNARAAELWGAAPEPGDTSFRLRMICNASVFPDGRPAPPEQSPMSRVLSTGQPVRDERYTIERADGSRVTVLVSVDPLLDADGSLLGGVAYLQDITTIAAELELADERVVDLAHLAAIVSSSDDAIISKSLDGIIRSWNAGAARIFGYDANEMIGGPISTIIPPELRGEEAEIIARLKRGERIEHFETVRVGNDGRRIDISLAVSPIRDRTGAIVGASNVSRDITERKRAEELQRLLMGELNHRVKNTLATVQSIANQTVRAAKDPAEFAASFNGRIRTLAHAHDLLTRNSWRGADLQMLVRDQLLMAGASDQRISLSGPAVMLEAQPALHLAMILHELGTNARKYGALSVPEGRLAVSWTLDFDGGRRLRLHWRESGGPAVSAPAARGFGTTLVEQSLAAHEGQACIHYRAEGVSCDIELPLPERPPHEAGFATKMANAGGAPMADHASPRPALAGKRVLVIEDEPIVALDLAGALTEHGCVVVGPAATLDDACRLARTEALDTALVDANLGGAPADEIAAALAERGVPFAFVTGYARDGLPAGFQDAAMINKPFSREEIVAAVTALVGKKDPIAPLRTKTNAKTSP